MRYSLIALVAASLANSLPIRTVAQDYTQLVLRQQSPRDTAQLPLYSPAENHSSNQHLEHGPRSVELLLTSQDEEEMIRVWLPLGKRIHLRRFQHEVDSDCVGTDFRETGDYPILPLHPSTVHIVNVYTPADDAAASSRRLDRTVCVLHPAVHRDKRCTHGLGRWWINKDCNGMAASFERSDGPVDLEDPKLRWFLEGREVESYECC